MDVAEGVLTAAKSPSDVHPKKGSHTDMSPIMVMGWLCWPRAQPRSHRNGRDSAPDCSGELTGGCKHPRGHARRHDQLSDAGQGDELLAVQVAGKDSSAVDHTGWVGSRGPETPGTTVQGTALPPPDGHFDAGKPMSNTCRFTCFSASASFVWQCGHVVSYQDAPLVPSACPPRGRWPTAQTLLLTVVTVGVDPAVSGSTPVAQPFAAAEPNQLDQALLSNRLSCSRSNCTACSYSLAYCIYDWIRISFLFTIRLHLLHHNG